MDKDIQTLRFALPTGLGEAQIALDRLERRLIRYKAQNQAFIMAQAKAIEVNVYYDKAAEHDQ